MPKTMDRTSTDDLLIPVSILVPEGSNGDPTTDPVEFAFPVGAISARQRPSTWYPGFWLRDLGQILAGITVGPGSDVPAFKPGKYSVWIRVMDNPTTPVQAVDELTIT